MPDGGWTHRSRRDAGTPTDGCARICGRSATPPKGSVAGVVQDEVLMGRGKEYVDLVSVPIDRQSVRAFRGRILRGESYRGGVEHVHRSRIPYRAVETGSPAVEPEDVRRPR